MSTHPNGIFQVNIAGSQVLQFQLEQGAHADIFLSADRTHIQALEQGAHIQHQMLIAENELALITPKYLYDNHTIIQLFEESEGVKRLIIGRESTPIGKYTRQLLMNIANKYGSKTVQMIKGKIVSEESNVRLLKAKVEMGEADAAFVYRTDVNQSIDVHSVALPVEVNVRTSVYGAILTRSTQIELASTLLNSFCDQRFQSNLTDLGFMISHSCQ